MPYKLWGKVPSSLAIYQRAEFKEAGRGYFVPFGTDVVELLGDVAQPLGGSPLAAG